VAEPVPVGAPVTHDFWGKSLTGYRAGRDRFQPMDTSLPGDRIKRTPRCVSALRFLTW